MFCESCARSFKCKYTTNIWLMGASFPLYLNSKLTRKGQISSRNLTRVDSQISTTPLHMKCPIACSCLLLLVVVFADFFQSDAITLAVWLMHVLLRNKKLKQERVFPIIVLSRVGLLFRHKEVTPKPVLLWIWTIVCLVPMSIDHILTHQNISPHTVSNDILNVSKNYLFEF